MKFFYASLIAIFLCPFSTVFAQWTLATGTSTIELYSIEILDPLNIYAAGFNSFCKSTDGGVNWNSIQLKDSFNNLIGATVITGMEFLTPSFGFATGPSFASNQEIVFRTFNSGANWFWVSLATSGNWPRQMNKVVFPTSTMGFAVGTNGRILNSSNSGNSWFAQNSGVSVRLTDIKFIAPITAIVSGEGVILKTNNNGTSWTATNFPSTYFTSVSFVNSTTGFVAGNNKALYKTTDGGNNWSPVNVNLPDNFDFTCIHFLSVDTGYATCNNYILRTTDGGTHWDKFITNVQMNAISFLNSSKGFACGNSGKFYYTNNPSNAFAPVSIFTSTTTFCVDSTITFTNLSSPNYTFTWLHNGQPFSTSYHASLAFHNPLSNDTISLVAYNSISYDTSSINFNTSVSRQIINEGSLLADTICPGQSTNCFIPNSQWGTNFQLYNNGTPIGSAQRGNTYTLTFPTGSISSNTNLLMLATRTIIGCGTTYDSLYLSLTMGTPNQSLLITVTKDSICPGDSVLFTLANSEVNVTYQLKRGTINIGNPTQGNGNILQINSGLIEGTSVFSVFATNTIYNCTTALSQTHTITVEDVQSYFSSTNLNPEVGESVDLNQNCIIYGGSYVWNFGPAATPSTSTDSNLSVTYNTAGSWSASLVVTSPHGCIDTLMRDVHVIQPLTNPSCWYSQIWSNGGTVYGLTHDKFDNIYTWFNTAQPGDTFLVTGNHGDILLDTINWDSEYDEAYVLTKFSSKGIPMWNTSIRYPSEGARVGDIAVDSSGNIFVAAFMTYDSVRIYSSDGTYTAILVTTFGGLSYPMVLIKYNKNGIYQWSTMYPQWYGAYQVSIEIDSHQNVIVGSANHIMRYDNNGNQLWPYMWEGGEDIAIDSRDYVYAIETNGVGFDVYDTAKNVFMHVPDANHVVLQTSLGTNYIKLDKSGNIYIAGTFHGSFAFANDTLTDVYFGPNASDPYIAKYNAAGQQVWAKQTHVNGPTYLKGFDIKDGNLVLLVYTHSDTVYTEDYSPMIMGGGGYYLYQTDTSGTMDRVAKLSDGNPFFFISGTENLKFMNTSNDLSVVFPFKSPFMIDTLQVTPILPDFNQNNCILNGPISCMFHNAVTSKITEPVKDSGIRIYPNPAHESVVIENNFTNYPEFAIFDVVGRKVLRGKLKNQFQEISLIDLPSGIYSVLVIDNNQSHFAKLIKE